MLHNFFLYLTDDHHGQRPHWKVQFKSSIFIPTSSHTGKMRCRSHIKTLLEEFVLGAEGRIFPALQAVCLLFLCFLWFFLLFCLAILITFILVLRHSVNRNALLRSKLKKIPQHLSLESRKCPERSGRYQASLRQDAMYEKMSRLSAGFVNLLTICLE